MPRDIKIPIRFDEREQISCINDPSKEVRQSTTILSHFGTKLGEGSVLTFMLGDLG